MRVFAIEHLRHEYYLADEAMGITIQSIIEANIMPKFEDEFKRLFSLKDKMKQFRFRLQYLRHSLSNSRLKRGTFVLDLYVITLVTLASTMY